MDSFCWLVVLISVFYTANAVDYQLHIDTSKIVSKTEKEYLSVCLDPYLKHDLPVPWGTLNFTSTRLHTLLRGLSPAVLRFGGTDADWSVFYDVKSPEQQRAVWDLTSKLTDPGGRAFVVPIFPQDIDALVSLAESADGKLLFDLNIQQRFGAQWDATNALQLMRYVSDTRHAPNVFFELGNEPNYPQFNFTGKRIAMDFEILRKVLDSVPGFENAQLVGPDIGMANVPWLLTIVSDFAKTAAKTVSAVTLHHYYFLGPSAKLNQYYDLQYFDAYGTMLKTWRDAIYQAAGFKIPIWIGETSDSYSKGSPNITNRYVSGLLWLDKLGISAKLGIKLVARQDLYGGNYPLLDDSLNPNPDYWLSHVFKQLVGVHVLDVSVTSPADAYLRAYAHCACAAGVVTNITVFMINLHPNDTASVRFDKPCSDRMQVYSLTPGEGALLSSDVMLNGQLLRLVDDNTLPKLRPVVVGSKSAVLVKALTFTFVVFDTRLEMDCDSIM